MGIESVSNNAGQLPQPPGSTDANEGQESGESSEALTGELQEKLFEQNAQQNIEVEGGDEEGRSAIELDLSQNVSMGVNDNTAHMIIETEVRTSLTTQLDGASDQDAPIPSPVQPGTGDISPENTAGRLLGYAEQFLGAEGAEEAEDSESVVEEILAAADEGFENADEILGDSMTSDFSELINEIQTLFNGMLEGLMEEDEAAEEATEAEAEESNAAQQAAEIAAENQRALQETEGLPPGLTSAED